VEKQKPAAAAPAFPHMKPAYADAKRAFLLLQFVDTWLVAEDPPKWISPSRTMMNPA